MARPSTLGDASDEPASQNDAAALQRAEKALRASEQRHEILIHELNHRVKNTLAMVQAVARQSFRGVSDPAIGLAAFEGRLGAIARVHDVLSQQSWCQLDLAAFLASALEPWDHPRFALDGPAVEIGPQLGLTLAMAIHELCTNAAKHGALSTPSGRIALRWSVEGEGAARRLLLRWQESGGPPVETPAHTGFGSKLIRQAFGTAPEYRPDGLVCDLRIRLS